ncbi:MAG: ATP-binding protein [Oscillospiraceae bacterium]|nr:ATP-binding protein [Oscillospiraceae bacterium]
MDNLSLKLQSLTVFRGLLEQPAMQSLRGMLQRSDAHAAVEAYSTMLYCIRAEGFETLRDYMLGHLKFDNSSFGRAVASGTVTEAYLAAAKYDISVLSAIAAMRCADWKALLKSDASKLTELIDALPELPDGAPFALDELVDSFRKNGVGLFARGRAFYWEKGKLTMVNNPDPVNYWEMVGYTAQREEVAKNTRCLIAGKPNNNVLLYGDSGTGKSATVKSLINMDEFYNLRIIEVAKNSLDEIPEVSRMVATHTQKFILYIDDLAFEQEDAGFSALKTALEGGLELRPDNVAIYATSNRRHMIREDFAERAGSDLHRDETIQERTSLSERFGLRILYMALDKQSFLETVHVLCAHQGLELEPKRLEAEANKWEIQHGGRTPRTAKQFVDYLFSAQG